MPDRARRRLPNRRPHELFQFTHDGFIYIGGIGRFEEDGALAEVFLNSDKAGTTIDAIAADAAIVASLALQYGADPKILRRALTWDGDKTASGPLGAFLDLLERQGELQ